MFSFFKTPRPRGFGYRPQYYDADKEARAERQRAMEGADDAESIEYRIRSGYQRGSGWDYRQERSSAVRKSNTRLILIILGLGLICYLLLESNFSAILERIY